MHFPKVLAAAAVFLVPTVALAEAKCDPALFGEEVTAQYPLALKACRGLKDVDGVAYVRFVGEVEAANEETVTVVFKDPDNKPVSRIVFAVPATMHAKIDGREVPYSKLQRGEVIDIYVPSNKWGLYGTDPKGPNLQVVSREDLTH
jgi:hypothetical protein